MTDRYTKSAALRQKILEHLISQRSSVSGGAIAAVSNATKMMLILGEIQRHGRNKRTTYTALVEKTVDAETMTERANNLRSVALKQKKPEPVPQCSATGYYRHNGMNRAHPIKDQGGQGVAWFCGIKSSLA